MTTKKTKAEHASTITAWAALLAALAGLFQTMWTVKPWWAEDKAPTAIERPAEDDGDKVASAMPPPVPDDFAMPPPEDFPEITRKTIMVQGPQQWGKGQEASQPQIVYQWPEGWDRKRVWDELVTKMPAAADSAVTTEVTPQQDRLEIPTGTIIMATGIPLALLAFVVSRHLRRKRERHGTGGIAC